LTSAPANAPTIQPVAELFNRSSALWATTYNVDLALFSEFLLPRLGDPPLNVVILADHRRLSATLDRIPPDRIDTLTTVNRRWLLRGVRPGGQAFHPKTYLALARNQATLLVGSGNLSTSGLDDGREVFTAFRSGIPIGDAAIAGWRGWMRRLVEQIGDVALAERFRDLDQQLPAPPRLAPRLQPVLHNLDTPLADQLIAAVTGAGTPVDELLIAAPFYDPEAEAVGGLLTNLAPRRVGVYVTGSTSVNGDRLANRLLACGAKVTVSAYEPDQFVHAKLVGVVAGRHGWLLSGSANLSQAALTRIVKGGGNVELAVLAKLDPEQVRFAFMPPGMTTAVRSLESLAALRFDPDAEPKLPSVHLITAAATDGGRVEVRSDPPAAASWFLDDLVARQPLRIEGSGRAVTLGPLVGRLVQLVDAAGAVLSNRVVVDDPAGLRAALTASSERTTSGRPQELAAGDLDTPLAQALVWLHRNLVMDVSERVAMTGGVGANEADKQGDDDLWERLEREQLARDPRASIYGRLWARGLLSGTEPIAELLEALRARTPAESMARGGSLLLHLLSAAPAPDQKQPHPGSRWKMTTRIRVRTRNVLRRWAAAQTDPRLMWVDPLAPAGNFAMIIATLASLRLIRSRDPDSVELTDDDLDEIWLWWLRPFVGTGQGDGWLGQLDPAALALAQQRLPEWIPEAATALCWLAVRPGIGERGRVIKWQAVLASALNHDLIEATETTARYLAEVSGDSVSRDRVDDQLLAAIEFIDDPLWCARTAEEFGVDGLELQVLPGTANALVRLDVRGISDPLLDARVPRLIVATRRYRRSEGVALYSADADWRLVAVTGEPIGYKPHARGTLVDSTVPLVDGLLEQMSGTGGVMASLFPQTAQVA
jgi:hypothetical protein